MPYMYTKSARERLCSGGRLPERFCNRTIIASALRSDLSHYQHGHKVTKQLFPGQGIDAAIYVAVVVVFYVAIIFLLVGTNIHRFKCSRGESHSHVEDGHRGERKKRHLVVRFDKKVRIIEPTSRGLSSFFPRYRTEETHL